MLNASYWKWRNSDNLFNLLVASHRRRISWVQNTAEASASNKINMQAAAIRISGDKVFLLQSPGHIVRSSRSSFIQGSEDFLFGGARSLFQVPLYASHFVGVSWMWFPYFVQNCCLVCFCHSHSAILKLPGLGYHSRTRTNCFPEYLECLSWQSSSSELRHDVLHSLLHKVITDYV